MTKEMVICELSPKDVARFYNGRGLAERWINEGKYDLNCPDLSDCHKFMANQLRLFTLGFPPMAEPTS